MEIFTLGFTKRTAEEFFKALDRDSITKVVDVRANNRSQLAGFSRASDLPFFLSRISDLPYRHEPLLCPDRGLLRAYRSAQLSWDSYASAYLESLRQRDVTKHLNPVELDGAVLLCSELSPDRCHRRLAAELLREAWGQVRITHL